ncbi:hypothetical protein Tco_1192750 [Tanacetum coccineum]
MKQIYKDQFDSIKRTRVRSKEHYDSLIAQLNSKFVENTDLKGQIQEKVFVITSLKNDLQKLKGKEIVENAAQIPNATTIAPGMFKLDLDPLAPSEKLVVVTPMNKVKKVRFSEPLTSSSNIHKHVESSKTLDSNTPMLPSTRLKSFTSASRSQPTGNKKNDRISQTPSRNIKNKVEVQLRRENLSSNKKTRVKDPSDANVKHTVLNMNSELIYVKCKQCMFDANHDACFLNFVNDVNVRSKSKSAKQSQQHNICKPTGKVFTKVGYKWKPTGKLFTLVSNLCPLTRIAKNSEPNHSWGSNATDVPSSSSLVNDKLSRLFSGTVRFGNDQIAKIIGYGDYQLGNVNISRVYCVEGLEHNLFSVGQFCDLDLEVAFQKNTFFIRNLDSVDLLSGSRDTNLYTISLDDMLKTYPICLLSKASKTKSWL